MEYEYFWWDLEDSEFKGVLYDSIGMYFLHEHPYTSWEEFESADPHIAYAHMTSIRFNMLEELFVDLRLIPQMLGVQTLPLKSNVRDINRYEWIKSIMDLTLFRFSSIRDVTYHFINQLLELGLEDHRLNIKSLKKLIGSSHPYVISELIKVETAGDFLRKNRNSRAHKGFSDLYTEDDEMFKVIALTEQIRPDMTCETYDIKTIYQNSCDEIYRQLINEVHKILASVTDVVNSLVDDYREKYTEYRKKSIRVSTSI